MKSRLLGAVSACVFIFGFSTSTIRAAELIALDFSAEAVSADGSVVVGNRGIGEAIRWTKTGDSVAIGTFDVRDVSGDGKVVLGQTSGGPIRWTQATGAVGLGVNFRAEAISGDGRVVVGQGAGISAPIIEEAVRWTQADGLVGLGFPTGLENYSMGVGVSADGSTVAGSAEGNTNVDPTIPTLFVPETQAFRWTEADGPVALNPSDCTKESFAGAISADGSTVVGFTARCDFGPPTLVNEAFRWTEADGLVSLGILPSGDSTSAHSVSGDGRVVVGSSFSNLSGGPSEAVIWDPINGLRNLEDVLIALGVDLTGWDLEFAGDISADGLTVIGSGVRNGNFTSFLASLRPDPLPVNIDIKPGSDPNAINLKSRGVIPVAILTTDTFDATTVDPLSIEFGPDEATETHGRGHVEDVDGDTDWDLVLHFRTRDTGIACGDTEATLTGETFDGQSITGTDSIKTVGCKKKHHKKHHNAH